MDKNGFSRIIYGGQPHTWLTQYLEYTQKMSAYPFRFFSSADEAAMRAEENRGKSPVDVLGDMNEERMGILKSLQANESVEHYFGQSSGDDKDDMHRVATFWNSARPPWIRLWTVIQQHEREKDDFGTIVEGKEVFRRTYVLGNNIFDDYGFYTSVIQDYNNATNPGTRGYALDQFYRHNDKLNTDPYSEGFTMLSKGIEYNQITPAQGAGTSADFSPAARIKDVQMSIKGVKLGATAVTTINFDVWNKVDYYNIYQRFFLTPGAQLVLDIGRSDVEPYDIAELVDLNNLDAVDQYDNGALDEKIKNFRFGYGENAGKQNPCNNNTIVGTVTKFDSKVRHDRFECSVTLVSKNRISLAASVSENQGIQKVSEKFINKIDTFAVLSTIEHILPIDQVKEIWNVNWLDSRKMDEVVAIIGNSVLSSQYATVVQEDDPGTEDVNEEGQTLDDSGNQVNRHIKIGDKAIPLVYIPKTAQDRGVYVQRLAYSYKENKLKQVTSSPKLKNNVYVSLHWLENELFNPLLDSDYYGQNKNEKENNLGMFKTPIANKSSVSTPLFRQQLYSNKIVHSLNWLYGSDCNNGGWDDPKAISKTCIIKNLFVNCDVVKRALSAKDRLKDVYTYILETVNEDSNGLYDFTLAPITEAGKDLQVIDLNFEPEGISTSIKTYNDITATADALQYEQNELVTWNSKPTLRPFTPGSVVLDIDFGFNVANNKLASMMAIQGGGSNHRFSINNYKALNAFGNLTLMREAGDPGYGWKYLPETKTTWEENANNNKNDFFTWHSHVPDIGSSDSTFQRMRNYQGIGKGGHDTLREIADKGDSFTYKTNVNDKLTDKEKEKLTKTVGILQKDVIKEREKEWKLESSKLQQEVVEDDDGGTFRWIFAKDWHDYYRLKHIKAMHNDNPDGTEDTLPRYNPPITGMKLTLTLNGMFGWKIGDGFKLDELPPELQNKVYFVVSGVTHTFNMGGWRTQLECTYRLRPGLKYNTDMDFTSTVMTNTKIGISKTYLQTLGFSESTAEFFSKYDGSEGGVDIHHAMTKNGGVSTLAEYKVDLKEFKDTKKGQKITDSFEEDGSLDEDTFSTNIVVTVDDDLVEEQKERQQKWINDVNSHINPNFLNNEFHANNYMQPVTTSTAGYQQINSIQKIQTFDKTYKTFEEITSYEFYDVRNGGLDYDYDFQNNSPFSQGNNVSALLQLDKSVISQDDLHFTGNTFINSNISADPVSNISRVEWNYSNQTLRAIDAANGVHFNSQKNDSLMYRDFGGDYTLINAQIDEATDGVGLNVNQSGLPSSFNDLNDNVNLIYVDNKGDTLHVQPIEPINLQGVNQDMLANVYLNKHQGYSSLLLNPYVQGYNEIDSSAFFNDFILNDKSADFNIDFVPEYDAEAVMKRYQDNQVDESDNNLKEILKNNSRYKNSEFRDKYLQGTR